MVRYTVERTLQLIPTLIIVTLIVYSLIHLIPGDPVMVMLGYTGDDRPAGAFSQEVYDLMRARLGLDQPLHIQYLTWIGRVLSGDFGNSLQSGQPVSQIVAQRIPATFYLAVTSLALAVLIAIPAGIIAGARQNTIVDYFASTFSIFGICIPNFWLALMLILLFSLQFRLLPSMGYVAPTEDFFGYLRVVAMPAIVLGTASAAQMVRFLRSDVIEQLHQDYVRTARSKGVPGNRIFSRHVLKNSLITTSTVFGFQVAHLLGGSTVVETVFAWPGLSYLLLQSIYARDFPIIQAVVLILVLIVVAVNFMVDLFYRVLDPRIKLS